MFDSALYIYYTGIKGIPLKKAPYYKKAPPLVMFRSGTRGGFLKFNSGRRPEKFFGKFCIENVDFQGKNRSESV